MSKRFRQYIGIFAAIAAYYIVHEGAHLVAALCYGVFKQINVMALGIQIDVFAECMTDTQLGIFCLAGPGAALVTGWVLTGLAKPICKAKSSLFRAVMWYATLALLILDPLYLSILCGFFGGGDMNGIGLLVPEIWARIIFAAIGILHGIVIRQVLLPKYTKSFQDEDSL